MSEYFPKPKSLGGYVKVELDLSNNATKADLKNAAEVNISDYAKKTDLVNLKSDVEKLDIDKQKKVPAPIYLSKLSDKVKNYIHNAKIKDIEDKIPDITKVATNTTLNAKINEIKNEIPSIINLAATAAFNAKINEVKNKIPNITNVTTTTSLVAVENKNLTIVNISLL